MDTNELPSSVMYNDPNFDMNDSEFGFFEAAYTALLEEVDGSKEVSQDTFNTFTETALEPALEPVEASQDAFNIFNEGVPKQLEPYRGEVLSFTPTIPQAMEANQGILYPGFHQAAFQPVEGIQNTGYPYNSAFPQPTEVDQGVSYAGYQPAQPTPASIVSKTPAKRGRNSIPKASPPKRARNAVTKPSPPKRARNSVTKKDMPVMHAGMTATPTDNPFYTPGAIAQLFGEQTPIEERIAAQEAVLNADSRRYSVEEVLKAHNLGKKLPGNKSPAIRLPTRKSPVKKTPVKGRIAAQPAIPSADTRSLSFEEALKAQMFDKSLPVEARVAAQQAVFNADSRERSVEQLMDAQFVSLSCGERARLLLPLINGVHPLEAERDELADASYGARRQREALLKAERLCEEAEQELLERQGFVMTSS
jgi:hypothetical protein